MREPRGEPLRRVAERDGVLGRLELRGVDRVGPLHGIGEVRRQLPAPPRLQRARDQARARRRRRIEEPGRQVLALEHVAQLPAAGTRSGGDRTTTASAGSAQNRKSTQAWSSASSGTPSNGLPSRWTMPIGVHLDAAIDHVAVERREQRRRSRAVEAGVVEEDLEDAGQEADPIIPRPGIRIGPPRVGVGVTFPACHLLAAGSAPDRRVPLDRRSVRVVLAATHPRAGAQGRPREAHADGALARDDDGSRRDARDRRGLAMAFGRCTDPTTSLFAAPESGWFHIKLALVVLGMLSGARHRPRADRQVRPRRDRPVPQWMWSLLLVVDRRDRDPGDPRSAHVRAAS